MKRNYYLILVGILLFASCQTKTETVPVVDPAAVKAEVTKTLDEIDAAFKAKDATTALSYLTDDGMYCGTDPTELWDKAAYTKLMIEMLADTTMSFNMNIDKTEIVVDKGGNSANVLRQFITKWSSPIYIRETMHFIKLDNKWMVDFSTYGLIPDNKDLPNITASVAKPVEN